MTRVERHGHVDSAEAFGGRLRALRELRGLTQRDLAFPGCSAVYVCRIERGDRVPSLQLVVELAARLETTAEYLCRGDGASAPFVVDLDTEALDAFIRDCFPKRGFGFADLTPRERDRLRGRLRREAQSAAGPLAVSIIVERESGAA